MLAQEKELEPLAFEIEPSWQKALGDELSKPYLFNLAAFLERELKAGKEIFPPKDLIFNAFYQTPFYKVKILIMGQDPYHGKGQAHGLSFSVCPGVTTPPSLKNIYKELQSDLGLTPPGHGYLLPWAKQGVMMLNATLTVEAGKPKSHYGKGWETLTDKVVEALATREQPVIFILWGKSAAEKCENVLSHIQGHRCPILKSAHPSPYSAQGFFGCRHFSQANQMLKELGFSPINWQL